MHCCGWAAICAASSSAAANAWPAGTTRLARPSERASSAATGRPVNTRSSARLWPISRGRRTVPPSISGTPKRRQNTPNTAVVLATRRSHHSASSRPPATQWPSMAAITGLRSCRRVGPIGPSAAMSGFRLSARSLVSNPPATVFRSAPAQKVPALPCSTATQASASASKALNASASNCAVGPSTALRTCGRFSVTVHCLPWRSTSTASVLWLASVFILCVLLLRLRGLPRRPPQCGLPPEAGRWGWV